MDKNLELELVDSNVNEVVNKLSNCYIKLIKENKDLSLFPSVMLWGQPGIGKSQGVKQIAKRIEEETKKKVSITDVRLLLLNPIDLRGIPVASNDKTTSIWLKPKILDMNSSSDVINILFLDEISAAPTSVQSAAYQITLDRKIGEHVLPNNCIIIAAGNRLTDKAVAYKMPKPLANRMMHFNLGTDFKSWERWAIKSNISPLVLGFLSVHKEYLNTFDATNDSLAFATPRSWEMVSNLINNISSDINEIRPLINGLIGKEISYQFYSWVKNIYKLPDINGIISGRDINPPKDISIIYAIINELTNHIKSDIYENGQITKPSELGNIIVYVSNFPKEFSLIFFQQLAVIKDKDGRLIKDDLFTFPEFVTNLEKVVKNTGATIDELFNHWY